MSKFAVTISIFGPMILLAVSSILIISSVAPQYLTQQLIFITLALITAFLLGRVDYQLYVFSPWPWYAASLLLLFITLISGQVIRGSSRWISIAGMQFQASEFVKPLLIIFVAAYLATYLPRSIKQLIQFIIIMLVPTFLIFLQPDLGSAILILIITASAIIASGVNLKKVVVTSLLISLTLPLAYTQLKPYQLQRLQSFLDPAADPLGSGYNALQATIAVGSGRFLGRGLGQGTQSHLRFLPERHTDFVFASLVEELGFFGGSLIIFAYIWLCFSLLKSARFASSDMGSIICLTSLSLIVIQATINIGMNMGLLPITGITLPLVSSGGSSIISLGIILGICYSVALRSTGQKAALEIGNK